MLTQVFYSSSISIMSICSIYHLSIYHLHCVYLFEISHFQGVRPHVWELDWLFVCGKITVHSYITSCIIRELFGVKLKPPIEEQICFDIIATMPWYYYYYCYFEIKCERFEFSKKSVFFRSVFYGFSADNRKNARSAFKILKVSKPYNKKTTWDRASKCSEMVVWFMLYFYKLSA